MWIIGTFKLLLMENTSRFMIIQYCAVVYKLSIFGRKKEMKNSLVKRLLNSNSKTFHCCNFNGIIIMSGNWYNYQWCNWNFDLFCYWNEHRTDGSMSFSVPETSTWWDGVSWHYGCTIVSFSETPRASQH